MKRRRKIIIILAALLAVAVPMLYPTPSQEAVDYYHVSACVTSTESTVTSDDIEIQIQTPSQSGGMIQTWDQEDIGGVLNMTINGTYTFRLAQSVARVRFIINNGTQWTNWFELKNWQGIEIIAFNSYSSYVLEAWVEYDHSNYEWVYLPLIAIEDRRQSIN